GVYLARSRYPRRRSGKHRQRTARGLALLWPRCAPVVTQRGRPFRKVAPTELSVATNSQADRLRSFIDNKAIGLDRSTTCDEFRWRMNHGNPRSRERFQVVAYYLVDI